jgi:AcrR family transcriptional regulator
MTLESFSRHAGRASTGDTIREVRDKLRRREDILRAARAVFAKKGYHGAKIEDIAAAAKVAKGTFYLYFPDKRSVFEELLNRIVVILQGAILTVDTRGDVGAQVKHNIRGIVALFLDDPTLSQILLARGGVDPELHERVEAFLDRIRELLYVALVDGQRLGIVAEGDARLYTCFAVGALKETLLEASSEHRSREEIVNALFQTLSVGFLRVG